MSQVAGVEAGVEWVGTFVWILLPGVLIGILLGWAEFIRRTGGRPHWRWLALSPLLFAAVLTPDPLGILESGIGGGAIGPSNSCSWGRGFGHQLGCWLRSHAATRVGISKF